MTRITIAAALSLAVLAGTAHAADNKIRVLAPTWTGYAPVFVAIDKGYFKELGIEVEMRFEDDRSNVLAAMTRGDVEVDMRTVGEHQGRPRDASTPGVIIGTIDMSVGGDGVIADGKIGSVKELKGKTVAIEPNIPARLLLQLALKKEGMTLDDLKIKEIMTQDTVAVFADSSIDAIGTYEPVMSQAISSQTQRNGKLLISSKDSEIVVDIIDVRQDDLKKNPVKYQHFLTGIFKAIDLYKSDPAEFIKLAAPHYNLSDKEVKEIFDTSLEFTDKAATAAMLGTPEKPGKLYEIFDTVMQLNLDYKSADVKLDAKQQIDPSVMAAISGAK
ncbi:NitT/TauT family transport system substrate-binding protein [Methylopila capsulata]|uniref:Aliphatic sulfonate ABC transporter substrate-binding protein n=1 Tax=Methylopila capsulata TaxID=61654 RepID=A0A9W6MSE6_9HYPH|nr:ABC transporter substrate-binding protein [Methylopila capsulata]MBM7850876.1 NitT/TauT family transport system substrate-binding protein [Methylopila capsulata]GLK56172.1 aliphatic sulfonate ABC transporter substrate-binding protein [Methylopila capsulata]